MVTINSQTIKNSIKFCLVLSVVIGLHAVQQEGVQINNEQAQGPASAVGVSTPILRKKNRRQRRRRRLKNKNGWLNKRRTRLKRRRLQRRRSMGVHAKKIALSARVPSITLSWPLERNKFWKSSLFGYRKNDYGVWQFHTGLDLAAPRHTPVHAAADGVAAEVRFDSGYGNMVLLQHDDGIKTRYAHLHRFKIKPNQRVKRGQLIATVGATGNVRGNGTDKSHLHFEILVDGKPRNPLRYLR